MGNGGQRVGQTSAELTDRQLFAKILAGYYEGIAAASGFPPRPLETVYRLADLLARKL